MKRIVFGLCLFVLLCAPALAGDTIYWESGSKAAELKPLDLKDFPAAPLMKTNMMLEAPRLYIRTEPSGAAIRIHGVDRPYEPGMQIKPGAYRVEVSKAGWEISSLRMSIDYGKDTNLAVRLSRKPWQDPATGMEFVWVPGGCYQMGCGPWTNSCDDDEQPVHEVCVDGFWMGKYEVTQAEWLKIVPRNPCIFFKGDRKPVQEVSWDDVQFFIRRLNAWGKGNGTFRLPTEAEWEYAARSGGRDEMYAGSGDVNRVAQHKYSRGGPISVGSRAPNGLRIYDMSGNVWEWCQDLYSSSAYSRHSRKNPIYLGGSGNRVIRGGAYSQKPRYARTTNRDEREPDNKASSLGFRLVRTD